MSGSREVEFTLRQITAAQGWPMADDECEHGRMAHDRPIRCSCFETVADVLLGEVQNRVAAQAAGKDGDEGRMQDRRLR
jgi:hypothetical protein